MSFSQRVVELRKQLGLTQQALSDATGIHVQQIKRYEAGSSLPTADALKKLAIALQVTSDFLLFEANERGPDDRLRYQFEAISRMSEEEQELVRGLLDAVIVKHQVAGAIARVATPATKGKE
ncbi:transcriptional regulator [Pseudomonas sp. PA15(2017)]|uniref:helix-turn-helix domain-containing protein n=1 Tax=Pseudomonas sp. PA15(2017) TaxID=1932111 RepID=UPI000969D5BE|nr:helix-turn-helix transcriptional regulator [Pseudomonas sp. PA15(2017)]OLU22198.1 transcriptional regulator [Pseudomonas sp. PA15(2017)]